MFPFLILFFNTLFFNVSPAANGWRACNAIPTNVNDSLPQANIFIHFDKEMYDPGETIWFKAYLFADIMPAAGESEFAVKLFNANGQVVASKKYPVVDATAIGEIELADTLLPGVYHLMAIASSTMASQELYTKTILIGYDQPVISSNATEALVIEFFPEGGNF